MLRTTSLNRNLHWRKRAEELKNLAAPELPPQCGLL
jgi:hypothetical protein